MSSLRILWPPRSSAQDYRGIRGFPRDGWVLRVVRFSFSSVCPRSGSLGSINLSHFTRPLATFLNFTPLTSIVWPLWPAPSLSDILVLLASLKASALAKIMTENNITIGYLVSNVAIVSQRSFSGCPLWPLTHKNVTS